MSRTNVPTRYGSVNIADPQVNIFSQNPLLINDRISTMQKIRQNIGEIFLKHDIEDDAVSLSVKYFVLWFSFCLILWLISFVAVMIQIMDKGNLTKENAALFIPMWVGSVLGILSSVRISLKVCNNATLVSRERRLFMRAHGTEDGQQFIDYDSLPLMRRLFFWTIVLSISFLFALFAQILYYLWFIHKVIGIWHAIVPISFLIIVYLFYMYIVEVFSLISCFNVSLLALEMSLYTAKVTNELDANWFLVSLPILVVQSISLFEIFSISYYHITGHYSLDQPQLLALFGYFCSDILSIVAVFVQISQVSSSLSGTIMPMILWTIAVCIFSASGIVILGKESVQLASSRGFQTPTPLCRTAIGWEASRIQHSVSSLLLGKVKILPPTLAFVANHSKTTSRNHINPNVTHSSNIHANVKSTSNVRLKSFNVTAFDSEQKNDVGSEKRSSILSPLSMFSNGINQKYQSLPT
eukprot:gene15845-21467_t